MNGNSNGGYPHVSYTKTLEDTIYPQQLDAVDSYNAITNYGATSITSFDVSTGHTAQNFPYFAVSDNINNKVNYWDGASWNSVGLSDFYTIAYNLTDIDVEVQNPSNKTYVLYKEWSLGVTGVRRYNNTPTIQSGVNDAKLCMNGSGTIVNNMIFYDEDNDSLFIENISSSNPVILQNSNITITRVGTYDIASPLNSFKIDITPDPGQSGMLTISFDVNDGGLGTIAVTINVEIIQTPTFTTVTSTDPICNGDIGSIQFTGLNPSDESYNLYSIDGGTNLVDGTMSVLGTLDLSAPSGNYINYFLQVEITDMEGTMNFCNSDTTPPGIVLIDPSALIITNPLSDFVVCDGDLTTLDANGTTTGGTVAVNYTYGWNNGVTNATAFTPSTLNYEYTITDDNGCFITHPSGVNITVLNPITSIDNVESCDSLVWIDGITYFANNNIATYNYIDGSVQGCDSLVTLNLTIHTSPTVTLLPSTTICLNNGELYLNDLAIPIGGTFSGDFVGNNTFNPLNSGVGTHTYSYFYTDVFGCSGEAIDNIVVLDIPSVTLGITNASCNTSNGAVDATIVGGLAPHTLYWSSGQTTEDLANLDPNNYYLNITDANLCYAMYVATVTSSEVVLSGNVTDILCSGLSTGAINLTVSGATGPYIYYWSNGETTEDLANLIAGQYEVFVTDINGCMSTISFNVLEPSPLTSSILVTDPTACGLSDGILIASVIGGASSYTYEWLDNTNAAIGTNSATLSGMLGGIYTLNITDVNNCTYTTTTSLSETGGPIIILGGLNNSSCSNDGLIDIDVQSSFAIQSYDWSNGETTEDVSNLAVGNYTVSVTDINGCSGNLAVNIDPILPPVTELCIITVDTNTNTNLVIWEKPVSTEIAYFIIYRETSVAGEFLPVDTVLYSEESFFTDPIAYPQLRSWRYKLSTVNLCGIESALSDAHKTIHVTISQNGNDYIISWDGYEGFSYGTFELYRFTEAGGWDFTPLASLPSNQFSYTDVNGGAGEVDYLISITPPSVCTSTKAQDHNASRSNNTSSITIPPGGGIDSSTLPENNTSLVHIYPNPFNNMFKIDLGEQKTATIKVVDVNGKTVYDNIIVNQSETEINFDGESGIYFIVIDDSNSIERFKIIKN